MNFFLLPHNHPHEYRKIHLHCSPTDTSPNSLAVYLYEIKEKIKDFDAEWDTYKEYTNPYEYIHTRVPNKRPIAQYKPLSRSYFKMIEIIQHFRLLDPFHDRPMQTFHLAEGPGGFIEALVQSREKHNIGLAGKDRVVGMTLLNEADRTIPSWKKSQHFLRTHPNVFIEYGEDGRGDLLSIENFTGCVKKYASQMDFITADGGFDFSEDFNRQEVNILPLLVAQICFAVCMQRKGGVFVLKLFDCFMKPTVELIYLLSCFYEKVYITKPQTSRFANSEKYLVCMNFHHDSCIDYYPYLWNLLKGYLDKTPDLVEVVTEADTNSGDDKSSKEFIGGIKKLSINRIRQIFHFTIPKYFMSKLEEYNMVLGQQQIDTIFATILLMENRTNRKNRIEHYIQIHTVKCIQWCNRHGI